MKHSPPHGLAATNRWAWPCATALFVLYPFPASNADTLVYLSARGLGENATPVAPQETLKFLPGGGAFHVWVQPDQLCTGISLDLQISGSGIRFTGATVHNPAAAGDTRWLPGLINNGNVTDTQVTRLEGGALAPLVGYGRGVGPSTVGSDPFYEPSGGFLFATISFAVLNPTENAAISLLIGHNLLSGATGLATSPVFLGASDGPVAVMSGATGNVVDLNLLPRPLHPSDFNSDGVVDGDDLLIWQRGYGIASGAMPSQGDGTHDGAVDADDLTLWETQFATIPSGGGSPLGVVPEPTALGLAIFWATIGLVSVRRWPRDCRFCRSV